MDAGTAGLAPRRADVVIIGGGIVGASCALFLAERGVAVVLCEKGRVGAEQSGRNWGWVRQQGRDPRELALAGRSLALWRQLDAHCGADVGFRQGGITYLAESPEQEAAHAAWLAQARPYDLDSRIVRGTELERLLPGAGAHFSSALYTASDGRAEPELATPAIVQAARRHGATVLEQCAVRGIETAAGAVAGVVTESGAIACGTVVLTAGAWSRALCHAVGIDLPQLRTQCSVLRTAPLAGPTVAALGGRFAFRPRVDGGYTVANGLASTVELVPDCLRLAHRFLPALAIQWRTTRWRVGSGFIRELREPRRWPLDRPTRFERERVLDPAPDTADNRAALADLARCFAAFRDAKIVQQWAGVIDVTPDALPVLGGAPVAGLALATGFSGHGFGVGPAAGEAVADLVTGHRPRVALEDFGLARFTDGSDLAIRAL